MKSYNPATQQVIWEGEATSDQEIDQAIIAARSAFGAWSRLPLEERINYLHRYAAKLAERKQSMAETISQETGKPLWEALQEVQTMIQKVAISIEAFAERTPTKTRDLAGTELHLTHRPHGVVAVFGPFNFPGHLPNGHIVPALLAGNTVVFKGSSLTPSVSEAMIDCWELPEGVLTLLQGEAGTGEKVAHHPGIDGIFFTGSAHVGSLLAQSPHKIIALEMGGNNPLIVSQCNDRIAASYLTLQSAFISAGQRCTCARRLILPKGNEALLETLIPMVDQLLVGSYTDRPEPFMGPVISLLAAQHLLAAQQALIERGGKVLLEMKRIKEGLPFLTPGIIDVTDCTNRVDEEYFGPLLQVVRVSDFEAAIEEANRTDYGLSAGLISDNRQQFKTFFHAIRAGVINWNRPTTGASSQAPFGGVGKSGNFHPSGYYAADYCAYPVASMQSASLQLPQELLPGVMI